AGRSSGETKYTQKEWQPSGLPAHSRCIVPDTGMTAFLPFQDTNPSEREQTLHAARQTYTYNYTHVSPLALVDRVPIHDEFTFGWLKTVAERVMVGLENMAFNEVEAEFKFHHLA